MFPHIWPSLPHQALAEDLCVKRQQLYFNKANTTVVYKTEAITTKNNDTDTKHYQDENKETARNFCSHCSVLRWLLNKLLHLRVL